MFANKYLKKQNAGILIQKPPDSDVDLCIVIPCYREPDILDTLKSVSKCKLPKAKTEVIIVINHSEAASNDIKEYNLTTRNLLDDWINKNNNLKIRFFAVGPINLKKKWAGAGVARKKGMDEAVRRFNLLEKQEGIIVSLDADTLVEENYLTEIEKYFKKNKKVIGATISFEHQTAGLSEKHLRGIHLYEQYLVYYKRALEFSGYPYSLFTIGSAFAVKAAAYVKRGGMNRRQAGEDFYFLQGLAQIGKVGEITSTKVYPSARLSDRVPFGTGPILKKWMEDKEDLTITYNFDAFADLKSFFELKDAFFQIRYQEFGEFINGLNQPIKEFIITDNTWIELEELNRNCSNLSSFRNRFFQKFNAFKILKFLNFAHEHFYHKENLEEQMLKLKNIYHEK